MKRVAIIGTGPAGIMLAKNLYKKNNGNMHFDFFEKLKQPFGFVKFGISPIHDELKASDSYINFL